MAVPFCWLVERRPSRGCHGVRPAEPHGEVGRYAGGKPDALLLFGPGEAKLQLKERLGRSNVSPESIVAVESTDKLTDPQIVAKVKEHYGIDRRTGQPWCAHVNAWRFASLV